MNDGFWRRRRWRRHRRRRRRRWDITSHCLLVPLTVALDPNKSHFSRKKLIPADAETNLGLNKGKRQTQKTFIGFLEKTTTKRLRCENNRIIAYQYCGTHVSLLYHSCITLYHSCITLLLLLYRSCITLISISYHLCINSLLHHSWITLYHSSITLVSTSNQSFITVSAKVFLFLAQMWFAQVTNKSCFFRSSQKKCKNVSQEVFVLSKISEVNVFFAEIKIFYENISRL